MRESEGEKERKRRTRQRERREITERERACREMESSPRRVLAHREISLLSEIQKKRRTGNNEIIQSELASLFSAYLSLLYM